MVTNLHKGLNINVMDENAKTIQLSFQHDNRKLAFDVMQAVLNVYFYFEKQKNQEENTKTLSFINNQLDSLAIVLNSSKDSLSNFQQKQNFPSLEYEEKDVTQELTAINTKIGEINEEVYTINYVKKSLPIK